MPEPFFRLALVVALLAPLVAAVAIGVLLVARNSWLSEERVSAVIRAGLVASLVAALLAAAQVVGVLGPTPANEVDFGSWLAVGSYEIPLVVHVDDLAASFSLLAAALTALVGRFSRTYLHKEPGFARFYVLLGLFGSGTQLVAYAGALDLLFAGWELIGISSALFIGFFHEREMPARSAVRAFATYRLCDVGLLVAMVTTHEMLGTTRIAALSQVDQLPAVTVTAIGALFLLAAMGKSAQLPFSGWLPRAMEGPTPSSALFYGAVSIHAGVYLLLRVSPVLRAAPTVAAAGVVIGVATAIYAGLVVRTHTDAKGALAHATLAQIGLIFAEVSLGWTRLALVHLVCHAMLRAWQFLRAPNMIHDAHAFGHHGEHSAHAASHAAAPAAAPAAARSAETPEAGSVSASASVADRVFARALHRLRLDERIDAAVAPILQLSRGIGVAERRVRAALSFKEERR